MPALTLAQIAIATAGLLVVVGKPKLAARLIAVGIILAAGAAIIPWPGAAS